MVQYINFGESHLYLETYSKTRRAPTPYILLSVRLKKTHFGLRLVSVYISVPEYRIVHIAEPEYAPVCCVTPLTKLWGVTINHSMTKSRVAQLGSMCSTKLNLSRRADSGTCSHEWRHDSWRPAPAPSTFVARFYAVVRPSVRHWLSLPDTRRIIRSPDRRQWTVRIVDGAWGTISDVANTLNKQQNT